MPNKGDNKRIARGIGRKSEAHDAKGNRAESVSKKRKWSAKSNVQ